MPRAKPTPLPDNEARNLKQRAQNYLAVAQTVGELRAREVLKQKAADLMMRAAKLEQAKLAQQN